LARAMPGILPEMSIDESLDVTRIYSVADQLPAETPLIRHRPFKRFSNNGESDIVCNAEMRIGEIRKFCKLQENGQSLMRAAMSQLNLSARAYHRILKLARTIADLAGSGGIQFSSILMKTDKKTDKKNKNS
jgi:magnesium chelatase family protein